MIGTITFNPAIDKRYLVPEIKIGEVQRILEVQNTPGGKGINVAKVAKLLGEEIIATGFLGGVNGSFIKKQLDKLNIKNSFLEIETETRCCIAITDSRGVQTELLEPGPVIDDSAFDTWVEMYEELLDKCSIIVASGSLPRGLREDIYAKLITLANSHGKKFFLDTSGDTLLESLAVKPFFIKPNMDEIKLITGKDINTEEDILEGIRYLKSLGIELISVTMGSRGSITYYKNNFYKASSPVIDCVNPVGSGDAFTAGMAVGMARDLGIANAIRLATACGALNAMEESTGYIDVSKLDEMLSKVNINKL